MGRKVTISVDIQLPSCYDKLSEAEIETLLFDSFVDKVEEAHEDCANSKYTSDDDKEYHEMWAEIAHKAAKTLRIKPELPTNKELVEFLDQFPPDKSWFQEDMEGLFETELNFSAAKFKLNEYKVQIFSVGLGYSIKYDPLRENYQWTALSTRGRCADVRTLEEAIKLIKEDYEKEK